MSNPDRGEQTHLYEDSEASAPPAMATLPRSWPGPVRDGSRAPEINILGPAADRGPFPSSVIFLLEMFHETSDNQGKETTGA